VSGLALSVVIPCWRDAAALGRVLPMLQTLPGIGEIIVADATESDECRALARAAGCVVAHCPRPSRGAQMNAGAELARGDVLLFHHADSDLNAGHVANLHAAMRDPALLGGGFYRHFDARHPHLRRLEKWGRRLNDWGGTIFGDQSVFVRRAHFEKLGGFADIPLMEDVEFSKRLRRSGRTRLLDPPMQSSARRFTRRGPWRTTLTNGVLLTLYHLGVSPARLHRIYYAAR
jgi:rSAM/selenodomain-associated transferase 2